MTLLSAFVMLLYSSNGLLADERPNFVVILADDVGQECLGCYGGESYNTPNLDHLAATGIRFQHCYGMPVCHPTRLTMLTGKYPFRFGEVRWGDFPDSAESTTFARVLADAGYATAVAGKWQLTLLRDEPDHPYRLGFQRSELFGWHEGGRYHDPMIYRNGKVRDDTTGHYGPDLYTHSLIEFMRQHRDQSFLAFYPMALCHDVTDDLEEPVPHGPLGRYENYGEMVSEMDRAVGRIMAALDVLKLREKTVILFVGDNGTPTKMILRADGKQLIKVPVVSRQNGHDVPGGKGTLRDTGTRVPLIANWPKTIASQQVVDDLVDMSDFWPTLLELAGFERSKLHGDTSHDIDGVSFAGRLLDRDDRDSREWCYSEGKSSRWVRTAEWKLYEDGRLIDMKSDKAEKKPILKADDADNQRVARRQLQAAWDELRETAEVP